MNRFYIKNQKLLYDLSELVKIFPGGESDEVIAAGDTEERCNVNGFFIEDIDKNEAKRRVYSLLYQQSGYRPPWGILTGVRPGKIVDELADRGKSKDQIKEVLAQDYLVMPEKIDLVMEVWDNQKSFYRAAGRSMNLCEDVKKEREKISVYIGIPFCPTRCAYCSFPANAREDKAVRRYLETLFYEIKAIGEMIQKRGFLIENIYIGGGTPTALTAEEMNQLLLLLHSNGFVQEGCMEFTVEAGRPDTVSAGMLEVLVRHGVNRVSVNPQTMKQETLTQIGRLHTPEQTVQAAHEVKRAGIPVMNMDLIVGLPGESAADFEHTLQEVLALKPQNITVHTLAIKKSSRFCDERPKADPKEVEEMLQLSRRTLKKAGYGAYYLYRQKYISGNFENTGYALPGTQSGYNIRIMAEKQTIVAMGAGGISKFYFPAENRLERAPNVSNYEVYADRINEMIERKRAFLKGGSISL